MKKVIIILLVLCVIYLGYNYYNTNKKILNTWNEIENDFLKLNKIIINFYESNNKVFNILYVDNNNDIVVNGNTNIKVEMSSEEEKLFNKLNNYYARNLSCDGGIDLIYIYDNYIVYRTESGYFGIIYSRDSKSYEFREDISKYHIRDNWYFQTTRNGKMFK